jgi:putative phosphoesterase
MRVALLSDIHGNLHALEAVLAALEQEEIDRMICLGDVAAFGPQPREVLARLRTLACPVVMGNTDAWMLDPQPHPVRDENSTKVTDIELWCAQQLTPDDQDYVQTFQAFVELPLDDGVHLLCFHGSPHSYDDVILPTSSDTELDRLLSGFQAIVMAGGHTHRQVMRRHREILFLNPGSVGLPIEYGTAGDVRNPPWVEYALVTWFTGHLSVDLRRLPYDSELVVQAARDSGMPHAEWWVKDWR